MNLTVIVPFWNGHAGLPALLDSVPATLPVRVVNDYQSEPPDVSRWENVRVTNLTKRGYFSGACNAGFLTSGETDVLILNQDGALLPGWERALDQRKRFGIIGDGVMRHPAWPKGYVQGTFMFIRRDVLRKVGGFNADLYPLWGSTCEYQLRACRQGFRALPLDADPYFAHARGGKAYGTAIQRTLDEQPKQRRLFIKTPPEISVVITTYNYGRYLREAVQSVLDQGFQSTEIIIVDDGSTDNTEEIGRALADDWQAIRYIHQRNQGASAAANTGIAQARGRFITVLDGDDWMLPTRLEKLYALAVENSHSVIYDDVMFVYPRHQGRRRMPDYDFETLIEGNQMHKGILYPKAAWQEVGGYSLAMDDGREDWEFNIRLGLAGWCGVHLREALYQYRRQRQGRTERNGKPRAYFAEKVARLHPGVYQRGELPMGCCGGKRRITRPHMTVSRTLDNLNTVGVGDPPEADWVPMEYTGANSGNQTIFGPSKTRYKYGRNERNLRFWAHPDDVRFLLETNQFKRYLLPKVADEPEPVIAAVEVEPEQEPDAEVTSYAQALVDETGINAQDVPHEGDKITIGDVREYLDELGIAY